MAGETCPTCGGSGQRSTARTANGSELERHERSGTPCDECGGSGIRPSLLERLRAEHEEAVTKLSAAKPNARGFSPDPRELANTVAELAERIEVVESGRPCCRECGSENIVAWYPEYARQGIELYREDDGTIRYDYTGENYDHADDAGPDDEYWCQDCECHSRDLDYLVGARDHEEVTTNDEGAMRELAAMLDGNAWESAADYLEAIARIVRSAGYKVREPVEEWTTEELTAERDRLAKQYGPRERALWYGPDATIAERIDTELGNR